MKKNDLERSGDEDRDSESEYSDFDDEICECEKNLI